MYGLLKHENKMSVLNLKLKRINQDIYDLPIKSKESLIFHVGARRFEANAIFSQHTTGDKHKVLLLLLLLLLMYNLVNFNYF